jgi:hypothetical protein
VSAPVALPALLVVLGALRPFFAVADRPQAIRRDAKLHEELFGGGGATVTQAEVVLGRTALAFRVSVSRASGRMSNLSKSK